MVQGYDVIGDVHGNLAKLEGLLRQLDYIDKSGTFLHPERQAIFVGDLIDRGNDNLRVVALVRGMVESGAAQVVMGNHEFNAIAYATDDPSDPGEGVRKRTGKNRKQHEVFLTEVEFQQDVYAEVIEWFKTMPFWLDLEGGIRVVHACWHEPSMEVVEQALSDEAMNGNQFLIKAATKGNELYEAVEIVLKGPELELNTFGLPHFLDQGGHERSAARLKWWVDEPATLAELLEVGASQSDGSPYPQLDSSLAKTMEHEFRYQGKKPVFFGHYWRSGKPTKNVDWGIHAACLDFSVAKGGPLVAYRWSGESILSEANFVQYPSIS